MHSRSLPASHRSRSSPIRWGMTLAMFQCVVLLHPANAEDVTSCMGCHWYIYEEWESSPHGTAWTEPVYQQALQSAEQPEECWSCHAPVMLLLTGLDNRPIARESDRDLGVNCISCHVDGDDVMHGPTGPESTGHYTLKDPLYAVEKAESLCLTCHGESTVPEHSVRASFENRPDTLQQYSCIDCHMPAVTRAHAEDPMAILDVPSRPGRRHTFIGSHDPNLIADALTVTLQPDGQVTLRNARAGHGIPGGITKTLIIRLYSRDSTGTQLSERLVEIRQSNQLLPGKTWTEQLAVTPATKMIGLTLQYRFADHQAASEYLHIGTFERVIR